MNIQTMPAARLTSCELLMRAAEVIERCGWLRGELWPDAAKNRQYHKGDPCCVSGALVVARGITDPMYAGDLDYYLDRSDCGWRGAVAALHAEINHDRADPPILTGLVEFWNDTVCTDRDQAIRVLRAAARR